MEGEFTKLLLVSANVGSIFEDPEHMLKIWLKEFLAAIQEMEPGMVCIHCQEVGGKNYEASMQHVNQFVKAMLGSDELQKYDRARVFLDEDYTAADKFTALGNLYFIHECVEDVMIFDFIECKFIPVEGREVLSGNIENIQIKEKSKYPQNFFPEFKWSRKGFLRTRWSVNNCVFDLINIHLFHDASNIVSMQKSPSVYAENRYRALAHTLQRFETDQFDKVPFFLFGDFNFRLDLSQLVKEITEKTESHETRGKKDQISKVVYNDANNKVVLTLESKYFDHHEKHDEVFSNKSKSLNKYDIEIEAYRDKMFEYSIDFPPSYPFSEDVSDGLSYMKTRCPSWCDRILLSHSAKDIIHFDDKHKPKYYIIGKDVCMGDHKPVYLSTLLKKGKGKPPFVFQSSVERRHMLSKKISINGEPMDFPQEHLNIHDYAEFEKAEELIPEFRHSLKLKSAPPQFGDGNDKNKSSIADGEVKKTHSFQDIANQVRMMEQALLKWPRRRSRSRHHSSSSEDMTDEEKMPVPGQGDDDDMSVHTDVSELSDTEDIQIDLVNGADLSNTRPHVDGENKMDETEGVHERKSRQSQSGKPKLESMHEQGKTEHEHVTVVTEDRKTYKGHVQPDTDHVQKKGRRPIRCPCVVL